MNNIQYIEKQPQILKRKADTLWKRFLKRLRAVVIAGLVVTVPIGMTIWIITWLFEQVDQLLQPVIQAIFGEPIVGVGFGVVVVLILLVGIIATNVIGKRIVRWGEELLGKVPVIRRLYVALKEVFQSFSNPGATAFLQVVLIDFPLRGMKTLGFITKEEVDEDGKKIINVFVPTAPNPIGGFLEIVREEDIIRTDIPVEEALKMVVSVGSMSPKGLGESLRIVKKPEDTPGHS